MFNICDLVHSQKYFNGGHFSDYAMLTVKFSQVEVMVVVFHHGDMRCIFFLYFPTGTPETVKLLVKTNAVHLLAIGMITDRP